MKARTSASVHESDNLLSREKRGFWINNTIYLLVQAFVLALILPSAAVAEIDFSKIRGATCPSLSPRSPRVLSEELLKLGFDVDRNVYETLLRNTRSIILSEGEFDTFSSNYRLAISKLKLEDSRTGEKGVEQSNLGQPPEVVKAAAQLKTAEERLAASRTKFLTDLDEIVKINSRSQSELWELATRASPELMGYFISHLKKRGQPTIEYIKNNFTSVSGQDLARVRECLQDIERSKNVAKAISDLSSYNCRAYREILLAHELSRNQESRTRLKGLLDQINAKASCARAIAIVIAENDGSNEAELILEDFSKNAISEVEKIEATSVLKRLQEVKADITDPAKKGGLAIPPPK